MSDLVNLGERLISGKGVLKVPNVDDSYRYYFMVINVIREPKNLYQSFEWNPTKSLYARLVFRRDKYVLFDDKVEYDGQIFQYVNDIAGQTLIAVKCAYDGILQSFVNLVNGIAGTPGGIGIFVTGVTDLIKDYENLDLGWDEVLFNCYSSTALQVRFFGVKYDFCDPDKDKKHRPPPPPPPLPKVPPGTPIGDLSPPYDSDTSDDGNTDPYEGDESTEFPLGEGCVKYHVVCRITSPTFSEGFFDVEVDCYGKIEAVGVDFSGSWRAYIEHHGEFSPSDEGCNLEASRRTLFAGILETDTVEVLSFTEVP